MKDNTIGWLAAIACGVAMAGCGDDSAGASGTATDSDGGTDSVGSTGGTTTTDSTTLATDSMSGGSSSTSSTSAGTDSATTTGSDTDTTGAVCLDEDDDGVTTCDGDCDDGNPAIPGAVEVCGDGDDNDCDGEVDNATLCAGIGTYVSDLVGDNNNSGEQDSPLKTIAAGVANALTIGNGQDVFVAEGDYFEKVTMVEGISVLGAHHCDVGDCTWERDSAVYQSNIRNNDEEGVLFDDTITRVTELDGFRVLARNGNPGDGTATAAISVLGGSPTISNNTVFGPNLFGCNCQSRGIYVFDASGTQMGPLIEDNLIVGGTSAGGGVSAVQLRRQPTTFSTAEVIGNDIRGGAGRYIRAVDAYGAGAGTVFFDNDIAAGTQVASPGNSFAMILSGGPSIVDSNRINADPALAGSCPNPSFWCGGLEAEGAEATITNNVIYGIPAPDSAAIFFGDGEVPFGEIVVVNNTLHGGGNPALGGGRSTALACRHTNGATGVDAIVGRIRNNILIGGDAANRYGVYEDNQTNGRTCTPEAFDNNDIFFEASATAADVAYREWNGAAQVIHATVTDVNNLAYAQANFAGDPLMNFTWHIQAGSPCIDAGSDTEAPGEDFEGEARTAGTIDVGADEL